MRQARAKVVPLAIAAALLAQGAPLAAQDPAVLQGSLAAKISDKAQLGKINLVDPSTGQVIDSQPIGEGFRFTNVKPGVYQVQVLDAQGNLVAASARTTVAAGEVATISSIEVAGGGMGKGSKIALGAGALGLITTVLIVTTNGDSSVASPSR